MKNIIKPTVLIFVYLIIVSSCGAARKKNLAPNSTPKEMGIETVEKNDTVKRIKLQVEKECFIITGAENFIEYLPVLKDKKIGFVTNQTGILMYKDPDTQKIETISTVDFLIKNKINVQKIFAPEHGFRGTADAGEHIIDGKDTKTGLPIISLYGDNKKPKTEQLAGIDIMIFDLQDVGARFYTYISTLHYIMEACAENNIQLIVFDRPNPNINIVDGPLLEKGFTSFVGMHPIPILHGMTIGEYAQMINGEKWLNPSTSSGQSIQCDLKVIPCLNYTRKSRYSLPIKPSPNLPNDQAINLYASLCLFEGTNISVGRGSEMQFQVYGSPFLPKSDFSFTPIPNLGAKEPLYKYEVCYGEDLNKIEKIDKLELKWLIKAYKETKYKKKFFNPFFTKLAGTKKLQQQIIKGISETEIRQSWRKGLEDFKKLREKYLIYSSLNPSKGGK